MEPIVSSAEVATVCLVCPVWGQVTEVTVLWDGRGLVAVSACPLSQPGTACVAACEDEVRKWMESAGGEER